MNHKQRKLRRSDEVWESFTLNNATALHAAVIGGAVGGFLSIIPASSTVANTHPNRDLFTVLGCFITGGAVAMVLWRRTWLANTVFVGDRIATRTNARRERSIEFSSIALVVDRGPTVEGAKGFRPAFAIYATDGRRLLIAPAEGAAESFRQTLEEAAPKAVYIDPQGRIASRRRPKLHSLLPLLRREGRSQAFRTLAVGVTLLLVGLALAVMLVTHPSGSQAGRAGAACGWMLIGGTVTLWKRRRMLVWMSDRENEIRRLTGAMIACDTCGYDFTGLPAGTPCPECGAPRPRDSYRPK
jgi:hypothetical protein